MPDTAFGTLLEDFERAADGADLRIPEDWMQGRAGYGGLVGALALKSMRGRVSSERKVRSLLIAFVGPVGPDEFAIRSRVLREGKSVSQVEAQVVQAGQVCCSVLGSFGADRDSVVRIEPLSCHMPP